MELALAVQNELAVSIATILRKLFNSDRNEHVDSLSVTLCSLFDRIQAQ